ncbi:MAG TPA: methyltransferase domain-containing protein [Stellaceae bacterium]|jgi:SAM-dependent methyltransferase|nr:methyltransferase domain-containing protein [Stellaceae bacterium]
MFIDIVDMRDFYERRLGQMARLMIGRRVRAMWPDLRGMRLMGLGYATPYLRPYLAEAERVAAVMPAPQGVLPWPPEGPNRATLAEEGELPLPDFSVDRVLLIHGLEFSEQTRPLLKEIWRVLAGGGRLIVVVPNRRGIWARLDNTPFGQGSPYTPSQLSHLLREEGFTPERNAAALFVPPTISRVMLRSAPLWEKIGARWFSAFGGVVLVEATKQIYAKPTAERAEKKRRRVLLPMPGTPSPAGP